MSGQHLQRPASSLHKPRTGDLHIYTFLNFNDLSTILSGHNLAFSTFQHRLASFNLPEIPIFVLARPVSDFLPGRQSRSFPVLLVNIDTSDGVLLRRSIRDHHSLHLHRRGVPIYGLTSFTRIIFSLFSLPKAAWRRLHCISYDFLLLCYPSTLCGCILYIHQLILRAASGCFSLRYSFFIISHLPGDGSSGGYFECTESDFLALVGKREEKARCVHIQHFFLLFYTMSFLYIEFLLASLHYCLIMVVAIFPSVCVVGRGCLTRFFSYGAASGHSPKKTLAGFCSLAVRTKF